MTASVDYLPIWKRGATAGERLRELALIADKHPERFARWICVYAELPEGRFIIRHIGPDGFKTIDQLGLLDAGAKQLWQDSFS